MKLRTHRPHMIISGGQSGVDQEALRAAKVLGIATGGTMPRGFMTLDGPRPDLAKEYGLTECSEPGYPARTEANVVNSDATLRVAADFNSPGELCTLRYIRQHRKPHLEVWMPRDLDAAMRRGFDWEAHIQSMRGWLNRVRPRVLNVAGNSLKTWPEAGCVGEMLLAVWEDD